MPLAAHFAMLRELTKTAHDESLRLSQRPLAPGTTDFVMEMVCREPDFAGALRTAARAYNLAHGGFFNRVDIRRDRLVYTIDDRGFPYAPQLRKHGAAYALMEGILIFLHAMMATALGRTAPAPLAIRTRRPTRTAPDGLLAFWDAPVRTGAASYALEYDLKAARALAIPPRGAPPPGAAVFETIDELIAAREAHVRRQDLPDLVIAALKEGKNRQGDVARALGVSVATMRRRLGESGVTFRRLRQDALNARAHAMLAQGRPLAEIIDELGFSDHRSFSRAFKAWNGETLARYGARQPR